MRRLSRVDTPAGRGAWALAGLAAGAFGTGAAQLLAAVLAPQASPLVAVGDAFIDHTPLWLKEFAIATFGTHDKQALLGGAAAVLAALSALSGVVARRRPAMAAGMVLALGAIGVAAALTRPDARMLWVLPSLAGALGGALALTFLTGTESRTGTARTVTPAREPVLAGGRGVGPGRHSAGGWQGSGADLLDRDAMTDTAEIGPVVAGPGPDDEGGGRRGGRGSGSDGVRQPGRRSLLTTAGLVAGAGAAAGVAGVPLGERLHGANASRAAVRLPPAARVVAPLPTGTEVGVSGVAPFRVPNGDFYRIDTALVVPNVRTSDWKLRVHGMVDREITLDWATLMAGPLVEADVTLCCVSNEVGGNLIGNARWLGLPIERVLRQAGAHPDADMVLSKSIDGFTASTPLQVLTDGRAALLAIGMNGQPLPVEHGFPVRMVVPGLYGYVSATKWVVDLEVTRFDKAQAYWTQRGWSALGPVKTESRIDVPQDGASVKAGRVAVAGVAWAQHRGIKAVQVRVDGGDWQQARLASVPSVDTWRQWVYAWDATPGKHALQVRAVDGTGAVQTGQVTAAPPNGATGWHTVQVQVS